MSGGLKKANLKVQSDASYVNATVQFYTRSLVFCRSCIAAGLTYLQAACVLRCAYFSADLRTMWRQIAWMKKLNQMH